MAETWLRSIMKALCGTAIVSCVAIRVKMRSVRPTVASAAGTKDLHKGELLRRDLTDALRTL